MVSSCVLFSPWSVPLNFQCLSSITRSKDPTPLHHNLGYNGALNLRIVAGEHQAACGVAADGHGVTLDIGLDEHASSRGTFCSGCPLIHAAHISVAYTPLGACAVTLHFGVTGHHLFLGAQTCRSPDICDPERALRESTALGASATLDGRRTHPAGETRPSPALPGTP